MSRVTRLTSRDNPLLVRLRKLARTASAYRKHGSLWLEGEHLCLALRSHGIVAAHALVAESAWQRPALQELAHWATKVTVVSDTLFAGVSALDSPGGIGFETVAPGPASIRPEAATVVLDRVQDAGNVGSILRSAAAMGFTQVLALEGSAGLWSPKVLRASMGAHFALELHEGLSASDLEILRVPLLASSSHTKETLDSGLLPFPCAWVFGHEGQGIAQDLLLRCARILRIPQPGGEESLNVAAAAAICLFATRSGAQ